MYSMYIMDIDKTLSDIDTKSIDPKTLAKMSFVFNAINDGWTIRKKKDKYIFVKPHDNRKEVLETSYLEAFIKKNLHVNKKYT